MSPDRSPQLPPPPPPALEPQALASVKMLMAQNLKAWALQPVPALPAACLLCDTCQVT